MPRGYMNPNRPEAAPRVCQWGKCGKTYDPIRVTQKCCSHKCRNDKYNAERNERLRAALVEELAEDMAKLMLAKFRNAGMIGRGEVGGVGGVGEVQGHPPQLQLMSPGPASVSGATESLPASQPSQPSPR